MLKKRVYPWHDAPPDLAPDKEGLKQWIQMVTTGFPDIHLIVEDQIEEGDQVVTRWRARGTHQGAFMRLPATGQPADITGVSTHRFVDGQIREAREWDRLTLMQQLGPAPGGRSIETPDLHRTAPPGRSSPASRRRREGALLVTSLFSSSQNQVDP